jgi:nucleotide-binding universal stress UspA family protein
MSARGRLVVGVCEHAHSLAALRYAADRADSAGEEVVAVHVRRADAPAVSYFDVSGVYRQWESECEELAFTETLAALAGRAPSWRYLALRGDPADCLAGAAATVGATAIVVGQHGRRRFGRPRRTVTRSLRRGPVPVVVVDADARPLFALSTFAGGAG